jgi:hypothetical protein
MGLNVVADPNTRIITVIKEPIENMITLDVAIDIYSELKDDWKTESDLQKLKFPLRPVGGDPISVTERVGKYVFLANDQGWRLQPYDLDHELSLVGNIFPEDSFLPTWLSRPGRTITIQLQRSAQSILTQGAGNNRIWSIPI